VVEAAPSPLSQYDENATRASRLQFLWIFQRLDHPLEQTRGTTAIETWRLVIAIGGSFQDDGNSCAQISWRKQ
jgi:hypothetical protein